MTTTPVDECGKMVCHRYKGILVPGCIGVAAAGGCGLTDSQMLSYCTCNPRVGRLRQQDTLESLRRDVLLLEERIDALENGE